MAQKKRLENHPSGASPDQDLNPLGVYIYVVYAVAMTSLVYTQSNPLFPGGLLLQIRGTLL